MTTENPKLRWGTAYFRSPVDARKYYAKQGMDYKIPLQEGSIFVGIIPAYNVKTQRLGLDVDGRYWIEDI